MLSFDFRIYSLHYDSLPSFSCWLYDLHCNIIKFSPDVDVRREAFAHPGRPTPPSRFILPTSFYPDIFHDRLQLVNVAVSYLLNLRHVHLLLSLLQKRHESASTRCQFGTATAVFISAVCRYGDYSPVSENTLRGWHSPYSFCIQLELQLVRNLQ